VQHFALASLVIRLRFGAQLLSSLSRNYMLLSCSTLGRATRSAADAFFLVAALLV